MTEEQVAALPIELAKDVADKYKLRQVIVLAWDGKATHVVTYGDSISDSDLAADAGNQLKAFLGWPEHLRQDESVKVVAMRAELAKLRVDVEEMQREQRKRISAP